MLWVLLSAGRLVCVRDKRTISARLEELERILSISTEEQRRANEEQQRTNEELKEKFDKQTVLLESLLTLLTAKNAGPLPAADAPP
jgi:hypothetical protein